MTVPSLPIGGGANAATNSAYNQLKGEKDVARDASMFNFMGPNAGAARARAFDTIQGKYLSPESNPYLGANYDAAANRAAKAYRFATAPGIDAQFAPVVVVQVGRGGRVNAIRVHEQRTPVDQVGRVADAVGQRRRAQRGRHAVAQADIAPAGHLALLDTHGGTTGQQAQGRDREPENQLLHVQGLHVVIVSAQ